ncbi:MAG: glycosyltransferase [Blastocatellia bacterium]|nr:glycosyltransferase [Blastocatellia bacterium]
MGLSCCETEPNYADQLGIGISSYNRVNSVEKCIAAVRRLTVDLVIANDGSTDGTSEMCVREMSFAFVPKTEGSRGTKIERSFSCVEFSSATYLFGLRTTTLRRIWIGIGYGSGQLKYRDILTLQGCRFVSAS